MPRKPKILAVASGGGHWVQLRRLRPLLDAHDCAYVSVFETDAELVAGRRYFTVPYASRFDLASFVPVFLRAFRILLAERPTVIVTTGSAPMLAFVVLGRLMGARSLWIDSIANSERLSTSGRIARRLANRCISQWPQVAQRERVEYWGSVL